jgi:hypothetical protein
MKYTKTTQQQLEAFHLMNLEAKCRKSYYHQQRLFHCLPAWHYLFIPLFLEGLWKGGCNICQHLKRMSVGVTTNSLVGNQFYEYFFPHYRALKDLRFFFFSPFPL